MSETLSDLNQAIASFDRNKIKGLVETAERRRQEILSKFPLGSWPSLSLERYALGLEGSEDSLCNWLERKSTELGSIRGGSSRKMIVYKRRRKPGWYFPEPFKDEQEAWDAVRAAFIEAFNLAQADQWDAIDELEPLRGGAALRLKLLHVYFPNDIFPIYSQHHLKHFLKKLVLCPT